MEESRNGPANPHRHMPAQIKRAGKKKIVKLILTIVTFYFIPNSNKSESSSPPQEKRFPVEGTMLVRPTKAELSEFGEGGAKSIPSMTTIGCKREAITEKAFTRRLARV
jgi:hypothetical protein